MIDDVIIGFRCLMLFEIKRKHIRSCESNNSKLAVHALYQPFCDPILVNFGMVYSGLYHMTVM